MLQAMIQALRTSKPQLGGMAGTAQKTMAVTPEYRAYQLAKQESGQAPVSLESFMKGER
jgi:hypothetical protein